VLLATLFPPGHFGGQCGGKSPMEYSVFCASGAAALLGGPHAFRQNSNETFIN
jgi:hypothetical protein